MPSRLPHRLAAVGGTFDVLHLGHRHLLSRAFQVAEHVIIGVTSDELTSKMLKEHPVQPFYSRVSAIRKLLRQNGWSSRATISRLRDPFGPAKSRTDLTAIIVTRDTISSAVSLNLLRRKRGLNVLRIYRVSMLKADDGKPISSTRIRRREIDRLGHAVSK